VPPPFFSYRKRTKRVITTYTKEEQKAAGELKQIGLVEGFTKKV
jgi:hypothetical protein